MIKTIQNYLPKREKTLLVQARVRKDLAEDMRETVKRLGITKTEFLEAAIQMTLDNLDAQRKRT